MNIHIQSGNQLPEKALNEMLELHENTFFKHSSPIPLHRPKEEVKNLLVDKNTLIFSIYEHDNMLIGYACLFPTSQPKADQLMPWVDFNFFRHKIKAEAWYISVLVIQDDYYTQGYGSKLIDIIVKWRDKNKIGIVAFDCNTYYSASVPILAVRAIGRRDLLFPDYKIAKQLIILGKEGLHANPVWCVCLDENCYEMVKNAFLIKQ